MKNPITSPRAGILALLVSGVFLVLGTLQASIIYTGCSSSSSCTLGDLFSGGSIQVDNLLFDNFQNSSANSFDQSGVEVTGIGTGTSVVGLNFESLSPFAWLTLDSPRNSRFSYIVTASNGTDITGHTLDMSAGDLSLVGSTNLTEQILYANGINPTGFFGTLQTLQNSAIASTPLSIGSNGATGFQIRTIAAFGTYQHLDSYQSTFDTVTPVPVPAAVWLLGSGLFGLIGLSRLRRKQD